MIVVGVDGSDGGAAALAFAASEAALRNARLRVVSAWEVPMPVAAGYGVDFPAHLDPATQEAFRVRAERIANDAAAAAQGLQPALDVEAVAILGQPADALLAQSDGADFVVVGRRGLGGFTSLLLGSVSQQVVQHATCPVVIVN